MQTLLCPPITSILSGVMDSSSLPFNFIFLLYATITTYPQMWRYSQLIEWVSLIQYLPSPVAVTSTQIKEGLPTPKLQSNDTPLYSLVVSNAQLPSALIIHKQKS